MTDKTKAKSNPNGAGLTQDPPKQPEQPENENNTRTTSGDTANGAGLT